MSVADIYQQELKTRGYTADPAQLRAVQALDLCASEWTHYKHKRGNSLKKLINHPDIPKGVYLYGGVGRGKSFLMELRDLQGTVNPLDALGVRMAKRFKLICFDEFHIADITDAMILHRLLMAMQHNDIGFVTTSNFKPDELYPDGLHRERLLPAIDLLNATMEVVNVDNGTDYRGRMLEQAQLYLTPDGRILNNNGSFQGRMSPAEMQGINRTPASGQIWVNPSNGATVNGNGNFLGGPNPALRNCLSRGYGC